MNLQMYPQLADLQQARPTFEEVVRANAARGGLPLLKTPAQLDAWIERRQRERKEPGEIRLHQIGDTRWVRIHERRTRDGGLVAIRLDVSELIQRENALTELTERLAVLSQTDSLTGLANRRAFALQLAAEVAWALEHRMGLSLLLIDVDHFKRYNDRYGHPAGDECLRRLAALLRESTGRPTDLVARLGGEEFALLLPHQASPAALALADGCIRMVNAAAIAHAGSPVAAFVTVSIGVAELGGCDPHEPGALMAAADAALYLAKQQGRNRAVLAADPGPVRGR